MINPNIDHTFGSADYDPQLQASGEVLFVLGELRKAIELDDSVRHDLLSAGIAVDGSDYIRAVVDKFYNQARARYDDAMRAEIRYQTDKDSNAMLLDNKLSLWGRVDRGIISLGKAVGDRGDRIRGTLHRQTGGLREIIAADGYGRHRAIGTLAISGLLGINVLAAKPASASEQTPPRMQVDISETSTTVQKPDKPAAVNAIVNLVSPKKGKHEIGQTPPLAINLSSDANETVPKAGSTPASKSDVSVSNGNLNATEQTTASAETDSVLTPQQSVIPPANNISSETTAHKPEITSDSKTKGAQSGQKPTPPLTISLSSSDKDVSTQAVAGSFIPKEVPKPDSVQMTAENIQPPPKKILVTPKTTKTTPKDSGHSSDVAPSQEIIIKPGDTLSKLAAKYGSSVAELARMNSIQNPDLIIAGQMLTVPVIAAPTKSAGNNANSGKNNQTDKQKPTPDVKTGATTAGAKASEINNESITQLIDSFISNTNIKIRDDLDRQELVQAAQNNGETWATKCSKDPGRIHVSSNPNLFKLMILAADSGYKIEVLDVGSADSHTCSSLHGQGPGQLSALDVAYSPQLYTFLDQEIKNGNVYGINELIYAYPPKGTTTYDKGQPHNFSKSVVAGHTTHVHLGLDPVDIIAPEAPKVPAASSDASKATASSAQTTKNESSVEKTEKDTTNAAEKLSDQLKTYTANINETVNGVSPERIQTVLNLLIDYGKDNGLKFTPQGLAAYAAHGIAESAFKNDANGDSGLAKGWFQYHGNRQKGMGKSDQAQIDHSIKDMVNDSSYMGNYDMLGAMQDPKMSLQDVVTQGYKWLRPRSFITGQATPAGGYRWTLAQQIYNDMQK